MQSGIEMMNELDKLNYDGIKRNLVDRSAVTAIRMFKNERTKFDRFFKVNREPVSITTRINGRRVTRTKTALSIVRIHDAEQVYDGRCRRMLEKAPKKPSERGREAEERFFEEQRELWGHAILPDFTHGGDAYEKTCVEIFSRIAEEENEELPELYDMFTKLFRVPLSEYGRASIQMGYNEQHGKPHEEEVTATPPRSRVSSMPRPAWR